MKKKGKICGRFLRLRLPDTYSAIGSRGGASIRRRKRLPAIPAEAHQIDPSVRGKLHPFRLQQLPLPVLPAEGKGRGGLPQPVDHPEAGDPFRIGIDMQGVSHHPCPARISRQLGYLPIGSYPAAGNFPHHGINAFIAVQGPLSFHPALDSSLLDGSEEPEERLLPVPEADAEDGVLVGGAVAVVVVAVVVGAVVEDVVVEGGVTVTV